MLAARCGGRAVAPADIHLTLAFIALAPRRCERSIVELIASLPAPGVLALSRVGSFDGRLIWIAPPEPPAHWLDVVAARLRAGLDRLAIGYDRKRLRAHLTLVRGARGVQRAALARIEAPAAARSMGKARICLVESTLLPSGSRYRWIETPGNGSGSGPHRPAAAGEEV
ncbi:MAG: hypothetical protein KJZ83_11110, partial [Burkholderiaceae bacterium]|nr:hypothetical protein [Burkholderiaceae bacterium]